MACESACPVSPLLLLFMELFELSADPDAWSAEAACVYLDDCGDVYISRFCEHMSGVHCKVPLTMGLEILFVGAKKK